MLPRLRSVAARRPALAVFVACTLLYALTVPQNHTETEDAYWYAFDVRTKAPTELLHPHHLLYLPVARLLYATGLFPDAFEMMLWIDVLLGAATVALAWKIMRTRLNLRAEASLVGCALLALSYGFWRYSVAVEVYIPAMFAQAMLCLVVFRSTNTARSPALAALAASVTLLVHAPLGAPLAIAAVPALFALEKRWRDLLVYAAVSMAILVGAFAAAYQLHPHDASGSTSFVEFVRGPTSELRPFTVGALPKALVAFGNTFVSGNFLFAIRPVLAALERLMPYRNLTEEQFLATTYSEPLAWTGFITSALLAMLGIFCILGLRFTRSGLRSLFAEPRIAAVVVWVASSILLVFVTAPENPELWVCSILPLAAVAAVLLDRFWARARFVAPSALVSVLFVHNAVFGVAVIRSQGSDYHASKAAWVLANSGNGDVVFTRDNDVFTRYLRYHSGAAIVNCWAGDGAATRALIETHARPARSAFMFNDVLEPPPYLAARYPQVTDGIAQLRAELDDRLAQTPDPQVQRLDLPR